MEAKAPAIKNTELMESVLAQLGEGGSLAGYLFSQVKEEGWPMTFLKGASE